MRRRRRAFLSSLGIRRIGVILAAFVLPPPLDGQGEEPAEPMRFGFSQDMFAGVNINDARAAMRVWTQKIASERKIPVSPEVLTFTDTAAIESALRHGDIDTIGLTTREYWTLRDRVPLGRLILSITGDDVYDRYLLLVRRDGPHDSLANLGGTRLTLHVSPATGIAREWLDVALHDAGRPRAAEHFANLVEEPKLARAVLPVFFGQSDACLVTVTGFKLMQELNPQLGKRLKPIAESPPLVASFFFFRADYQSSNVQRIIDEFVDTADNPAKQQIITLFQRDSLVEGHPEALAGTMALLDRHALLFADPKNHPAPR